LKNIASAIMVVVAVGLSSAALGQDWIGRDVGEIRFEGLERISEKLVQSQLETQAGKPYNPRAVARDIRRLYDLGYFDHIEVAGDVDAGKLVLTFACVEKQLIEEVRIMGNDKVRLRQIRGVLTWREGESFVPDAFDDERQAILDLYQSKGFPNARVDIVVDDAGPGRVRLSYMIDEGKKARISGISFEGNEALSARKLRRIVKTRRAWWFIGGKYDETKFEADLDKIVEEYGNVGRLEAEVDGTTFDYSPNGKHLRITIGLAEGAEYSVESLDVASNTVFDDDEMLDTIQVQAGDVHNKGQVAEDAQALQGKYLDSGYVDAEVTAQTTLDREKKTTFVVHQIEEGELKYLSEIDITGNSVTKDEVIRRQLLIAPGDRFDGTAVKASKQRVENTDYFDEVRATLAPVEASDLYTRLLLDVEEGKTGNFNFGAGYSTEEKLGFFAELRLNNFDISKPPRFSGGGQQLSLRTNVGDVRNEYSLSFTDPEIFGYPFAFGFDVFDESYEYTGGVEYTEQTQGAQIRLGKTLSPYVTVRTALGYSDIDISDLSWLSSPQLQRNRGGSTTISNAWVLSRNTLDRYMDPSTGSRHDLVFTLAGLGGDNHYTKVEHDSTWYWPLGEEQKWILSFRTREGWVDEYGSSDFVPLSARFFAGGTSTVRGYDTQDIGPKAPRFIFFGERDAIGGELRLLNNLELKYKLTEQFRVYGFLDSGGVWETAGDFDYGETRHSVGLGFGVDVPRMGPIRVDYGVPINPDDDQGHGRLHLLTGLRF